MKFFSLPRLGAVNTIELGFRGEPKATEKAFGQLEAELVSRAIPYQREGAAA